MINKLKQTINLINWKTLPVNLMFAVAGSVIVTLLTGQPLIGLIGVVGGAFLSIVVVIWFDIN